MSAREVHHDDLAVSHILRRVAANPKRKPTTRDALIRLAAELRARHPEPCELFTSKLAKCTCPTPFQRVTELDFEGDA